MTAREKRALEAGGLTRGGTRPDCANCGKPFWRPKYSQRKCCSKECTNIYRVRDLKKDEYWWINTKGYLEGRVWEEGTRRRVRKHRWLMEQHLGRKLLRSEDVHHKDGDKLNNAISNLEVIDNVEHAYLHNRERAEKYGWKPSESEVRRIRLRSIDRANKSKKISTLRQVRSMAARMYARHARRNPERSRLWLAVYDRYLDAIDQFHREECSL